MSWVDNLEFEHYSCYNKSDERVKYEKNYTSLYVVMTRKCNAQCPFCEFRGNIEPINVDIFKRYFNDLLTVCNVTTVHFTGGEPSLELSNLFEICKYIKTVSPYTETSVNTNGVYLHELINCEYIDNVALSRHHYSDSVNQQIFGVNNVATLEDIRKVSNINKLHVSCNLMKGYIDNTEELQLYLDTLGSVGVQDVGLVGLMTINDFCKEHYINISDIHMDDLDRIINNRWFYKKIADKKVCECFNFLYTSKDYTIMSVYYRHAIDSKLSGSTFLVYEENHIKKGFNGQNLI